LQGLSFIPESYLNVAAGVLFLAMSGVSLLLVIRVGEALPRRSLSLWISALFAACGFAQLLDVYAEAHYLFALRGAARLSLLVSLLAISVLAFFSISQLIAVLKAGLEIIRRRGQERFYALVHAAPMAVVSTDCNGRITSWNPSAERIFGWRREEILGTYLKTVPPERKAEQDALLRRTLDGQITSGFESVRLNHEGREFPVSISTAPLYNEGGSLIGLMATIEDISERKRIERELKVKSATLAAVTQALNTFLESGDWAAASKQLLAHALSQTGSESGFLGAVLDGPVLRILAIDGLVWNLPANRQLYEAKLSQQAAQGYFEVTHHHNLLGEVIEKQKTVVSNQPSADSRSGGIPPGHPSVHSFLRVPILKGSSVVGLIAVANRPGGYTGEESRSLEAMSQATGVLFDNYHQSLKRTQLEEQRARLESEFRQAQKMEVLGQLSGGIAHDFNNMLMVLSGSTELLDDALPANSPGRRYVEQIRRTVEKASAITKQLLAFSRKQVLEVKLVDLHEVLTDCEFMLPRLLGSDVLLTFQADAAHSWILADAGQLEQVIANLAINSRDAMPVGGSLTISTRNCSALPDEGSSDDLVAQGPGWIVLEVRDTGCGMDEETRSHLFEPFFTTKPTGKGTGLGLSTVYGTVCQFGGHIYLDSQPGVGTNFQLFFPVRDAPLPQQSSDSLPRKAENGRNLTILLADDEPGLRAAVAEYLRNMGHQVLESHSPDNALELAANHREPIDVLLTDIVMPGIRGIELAERVTQSHPDVHVIYMMSGYAQGLPEAQVPSGASFLQKPFRFASLAEQLKLVSRKV
jgi:two-component system cell cycle sensor histidine kinase/response regulator CckA